MWSRGLGPHWHCPGSGASPWAGSSNRRSCTAWAKQLVKKMSSGQAPRGRSQPALLDVPTGGDHLASSQKPATARRGKSFSLPGNSPANEKSPGFRPARLQWTVHSSRADLCLVKELPLLFPGLACGSPASDLKPDALLFLNEPILSIKSCC